MLVPFKLSEHLLHYFFRELKGSTKKYVGREVKVMPIDKNSFIGKIIISHLVKTDVPTKNIRQFNLFIEMVNVKRERFCKKQKLFKKENLENSFVELPEQFMNDINGMLDDIFRENFFFYVHGSSDNNNEGKITKAIRRFMDDYDLWYSDFDLDQLRQIYYRMLNDGPGKWLQNRDSSNVRC